MVLLENRVEDISQKIGDFEQSYDECVKKINLNEKQNEEALIKIEEASRLENIDIDMKKLYDLQYIKFRYGSIPKKNLEEIKKELENLNIILLEVKEEGDLFLDNIFYDNRVCKVR